MIRKRRHTVHFDVLNHLPCQAGFQQGLFYEARLHVGRGRCDGRGRLAVRVRRRRDDTVDFVAVSESLVIT